MEKKKDILQLAIITLIIMLVNIVIYFNKYVIPSMKIAELEKEYRAEKAKEHYSNDDIYKYSENEWVALQFASEQDRMKTYFNKYMLVFVSSEKYEEAYDLLYSEFKESYFKTLEDFTKYVKEKYPRFMTIVYDDVQRQGDYYIVSVTIKDIAEKKEPIKQKFIFREYDFDNFIISFSVE